MPEKWLRMTGAVAMLLVLGCTPPAEGPAPGAAAPDSRAPTATRELQALFDDEWATQLARDPLFASSMGVSDYNDSLPIDTPADHQRFLEEDLAFLERLEAIERSPLNDDDRLNYDLFGFIVQSRATLAKYKPYLIPILSDGGFHMRVQRMYEAMPFTTIQDYENYLSRLNEVAPYFAQNIANMREGLRVGMSQPKAILDGIEPSIEGPIADIADSAEDSIFLTPFRSMPSHFPDGDRERPASPPSKASWPPRTGVS